MSSAALSDTNSDALSVLTPYGISCLAFETRRLSEIANLHSMHTGYQSGSCGYCKSKVNSQRTPASRASPMQYQKY